jgi:hypothetical protein
VQSGTTADTASGFYDGVNTLTLTTVFVKGDSMRSRLVVPPGYDPGQVTINEKSKKDPLVARYCGNLQCDAQVLLGVFPTGDQPDDPIHLFLIYRDDARPGNEVWVHGGAYDVNTNPAFLAPTCTTPGVANPAKCVNSITSAGGQTGTKTVEILFAEGADPGGAKR